MLRAELSRRRGVGAPSRGDPPIHGTRVDRRRRVTLRVAILGGDGFCGWPAALRLSAVGHDVSIVDNLSRRRIDVDLGTQSLTPIETIDTRLEDWQRRGGTRIGFFAPDSARDYAQPP